MTTKVNSMSQPNRQILSGSEKNIRVSGHHISYSTRSGEEGYDLHQEVMISKIDAKDQQTPGFKINKS